MSCDLITPVIRLVTMRADVISARALSEILRRHCCEEKGTEYVFIS
jgi:hypothetical protein